MGAVATSLTVILVSMLSAAAGLAILRMFGAPPPPETIGRTEQDNEGVIYLFDDRTLIDATDRARSLLPHGKDEVDDWNRFIAAFGPRFPKLQQRMTEMTVDAPTIISERPGDPASLTLHAELHNGIKRIALIDPRITETPERLEQYAIQAMEIELEMLRSVAEDSPVLTWKQQDDGTVIWANVAYMGVVRKEFGDTAVAVWPPRTLFAGVNSIENTDGGAPRRVWRKSGKIPGRTWYELRTFPVEDATLCFATPIDELVQAESSLKEFIGTLGKTFAQLPIGLAIFDAKRRLVLFNPALMDLTSLGAEVLTQRPTLHAFLDALRENQCIPEPRDYKSWRLRIARLEAAATDGRYKETWTLPTGQTYRVTGQPHPDGAVAFLFEDISSEVSLKRRFRSEIDLTLSILNALDHGIAVFQPDGVLSLSNASYATLWGVDPTVSLSRITLDDAIRHWNLELYTPEMISPLRAFVFGGSQRQTFAFEIVGPDNTSLNIQVSALPQRASLIEFHIATDDKRKSEEDTILSPAIRSL